MSEEAVRRRPGMFFWVGIVLWGVVGAVLFSKWQAIREEQALAMQADEVAAAEAAKAAAADEAEDDGKQERTVINITWSEKGLRDFEFTDATGQKVTKNDLLGEPWIASFIFTSCAGTCPRVTNSMDVLQRRYKDKPIRFVTFTVDPERDTVDVLKHYSDKLEANPERWMFLTGDKDKLYSLINQDFLMPVRPEPVPEPGFEIIHTSNVCLVDATGRVIGKYNSLDESEMIQCRKDLDRLLTVEEPAEPAAE